MKKKERDTSKTLQQLNDMIEVYEALASRYFVAGNKEKAKECEKVVEYLVEVASNLQLKDELTRILWFHQALKVLYLSL